VRLHRANEALGMRWCRALFRASPRESRGARLVRARIADALAKAGRLQQNGQRHVQRTRKLHECRHHGQTIPAGFKQ
jgi:hypothetical protein